VGKTPVLLSLLILVLGALEKPGAKATLPSSIYELYTCAMDAAIANSLDTSTLGAAEASGAISPIELAKSMLRRIATANMLAQRRTFSLERHVLETLAPHPDELRLWRQLLHTCSNGASSPVPLVKVLAFGRQTGEFQFKHLSFQEALFVQAITRREADAFWQTDKVAAARLNDAFYTNTFRIGEGCLGHALGRQRPTWSFAHELLISGHADRGLARLHRLLPRSVSLASLTLPLNPSGDAASDFSVPISEEGPSPFWMLPSLPAPLNQSFRSARVLGAGKARVLCARRYLVTSPLDARGTPEPWVALEPGGSQHAALPAAWFEAETGAIGLEFGCVASDEATDGAGGEDGEDGDSSSLPSSRSGSTTASAARQDSAALEGDHVILRKHTQITYDQAHSDHLRPRRRHAYASPIPLAPPHKPFAPRRAQRARAACPARSAAPGLVCSRVRHLRSCRVRQLVSSRVRQLRIRCVLKSLRVTRSLHGRGWLPRGVAFARGCWRL